MVPRLCALLLAIAACSSTKDAANGEDEAADVAVPPAPSGEIVRTSRDAPFAEVLEDLAKADAAFVGGRPGDPAHQELQLAVVDYLAQRGRLHAIGLDIFDRGSQAALDEFVFGRIGEDEMRARTGLAQRPDFPYELYRPVLMLARERRLPLLALRVESGIRAAVEKGGLDALTPEQRMGLPAISPSVVGDSGLADQLEIEVAADVIVEWWRTKAPGDAQVAVLAAATWVAPRAALPERLFLRAGRPYGTLVALPGKAGDADPARSDRSFADYVWFTGGD